MKYFIILAFPVTLFWADVVFAQQSLKAAQGTTSIITTKFGSLSLDTKESALTLTDVRGISDEDLWQNNLTATIATQKGKRDLFSKGEFRPGFEILERLILVNNRPKSDRQQDLGGYTATFISVGFDFTLLKTVDYEDAAKTQLKLDEKVGRTLKLGLGFNWAPTDQYVFGASANYLRNWSMPIQSRAKTACVEKAQGTNSQGEPVTVSDCSERYFGGVRNDNGGQFRLDFVGPRLNIRKIPADAKKEENLPPEIGPIVALSAEVRDRRKPQYNFGLGPALYKGGRPNEIVAAILFELNDFTNGSGEFPDVSDRFAIRLYIGLPFN